MINTVAIIVIDIIMVGRIVIMMPHAVGGSEGQCGNFVGIWERRIR